MSNTILTAAMQPSSTTAAGKKSWFEAMADAWGQALDTQAQRIVDKSESVSSAQATSGSASESADSPKDITELTAMSLRMSFLASSSHTAISSVGSALETMARKQ
jgi:hypothetical protein